MKYYIIYEIIKNEKGEVIDIRNCYDNENTKKISDWLKIDYKNLSHYTAKDIDNINCKLKDNKYFILKDFD